MGWTTTDLGRNRMTLQQAKDRHALEAVEYSTGVATIIAQEWHTSTWYAIIRRVFPDHMHRAPITFLRVDLIEQSPSCFGYKDMTEEMGPYVSDKPSATMRAAIYKHIPKANEYARGFRDAMGIKYDNKKQLELLPA